MMEFKIYRLSQETAKNYTSAAPSDLHLTPEWNNVTNQ
jgi:hypothetical protein